jgi:MSHA biogenesis protein MshI
MLVELRPDSHVAAEALAALAFADGDYLAAARHCLNLTEGAPDRFEHWFNLGVAYQRMGGFQKAAQAFERAVALNPNSAVSHLNWGVARQDLGDLAGARASYESALQLDASQPGVLWNLALVLEQQGERTRAEELYARIPEDATEHWDGVFRLGYLRLLSGDFAASAEAFDACLQERPEWPEAWLNAGIAHARSGQAERARRAFEEALAIRPDSSDAVRGLAALALESQDYEKAFELHRRLIDIGEAAQRNVAALFEQPGRGLAFLAFCASGGLLTITMNGELYAWRTIVVKAAALADRGDADAHRQLHDRIALEVQRSLDNFDRLFSQIALDRLLVAPHAGADALVASLRDSLALPVARAELGDVIDCAADARFASGAEQAEWLHPIGLALRDERARAT